MRTGFVLLFFLLPALSGWASELSRDETVVLFPALGKLTAKGDWEINLRGLVFERERRPGATTLFAKYLGLDENALTGAERQRFRHRSRLFLIDAEHGKVVTLQVGRETFRSAKSIGTGCFDAQIHIRNASGPSASPISITALDRDRKPIATGLAYLINDTGFSVISDIDDTIKVTEVRNRDQMLRNTFVREFQPAPGMADLYRRWASQTNLVFHYVSAGPCQLLPLLDEYLHTNTFPSGPISLRVFDWRSDLFATKSGAERFKPGAIEAILKSYPQRRFVMVGDSGEHDPEIYGAIARRFPKQILRIYIRDVTNDPPERYQKAFRNVPANEWRIFKHPVEIQEDNWMARR
jgi:phosphatidate phosphatase APP1